MSNEKKFDCKHLTTTQRIKIEKGLMDGDSFASIARSIDKHPSTVAKEIKKYRYFPQRENPKKVLQCAHFKSCQMRFLCENKDCVKPCKLCYDTKLRIRQCSLICPDYQEPVCPKILKTPYVCNGCLRFRRCELQHALYSAQQADESSHELLVSSRDGINQSPADIALLDELISPLLKQGQSLAHIYAHHGHEIPCSRRTLYNYIDKGVFTAKNIDLRRRVRYNCKERKKGKCVIEVFDTLSEKLGVKVFQELFPVILTDNGTEFQFPERMECDSTGEMRTKLFFCNPNSSWRKGMLEKNHEFIRYVIPKGQSLDPYNQKDATVLMNHINSEARDILNGCTPYKLSLMLLNNKLLKLAEIPPDKVTLRPQLLKK